ncbi:energy transducer TonB [Flavobacterium sp. MAH-1]|uniref:Energy transducer TonB n=1 Tax=Flavobacterium agri TaxID=2743471 RepID=A0A7Y9C7Q8_9FLAO|nr:energy transducer TonB [Flavobacterium agri]NUY82611.1 energy transducer TonB [Flavobacterium agri]NYA72634.1 energy transducer TonB [Flavobacterium agri]
MKLDLLRQQWLDIVFEGKNKLYGAYQLRKQNPRTTMLALLFGAVIFAFLVSTPMLARLIPEGKSEDASLDTKIVTIKIPPKQKPPENLPPPPPPPPKVDQIKFVKPVVAKAEEVVEEPPKMDKIEDKKVGTENIKGDPDAPVTIDEPVGNGPKDVVEDNNIYNAAGIEVKPEFPGGIEKFYKFVRDNYRTPEDAVGGRMIVSFVVEKDGSLTDIKVPRPAGPGTAEEAIRMLKRSPKWTPAEQNGKKVRCAFTLPITIQAPE